jgi:hypothetical protein
VIAISATVIPVLLAIAMIIPALIAIPMVAVPAAIIPILTAIAIMIVIFIPTAIVFTAIAIMIVIFIPALIAIISTARVVSLVSTTSGTVVRILCAANTRICRLALFWLFIGHISGRRGADRLVGRGRGEGGLGLPFRPRYRRC